MSDSDLAQWKDNHNKGYYSEDQTPVSDVLIDAAPELYEVLSNLLDEIAGVPMRAVDCDQDAVEMWMRRADKVIARVRDKME